MIEKLDLWHSSDVEVRKKINEIIEQLNKQQKDIEKLKLEFGVDEND